MDEKVCIIVSAVNKDCAAAFVERMLDVRKLVTKTTNDGNYPDGYASIVIDANYAETHCRATGQNYFNFIQELRHDAFMFESGWEARNGLT